MCDKKKVVCRLRKVVSSYSGNTTNFATHLEEHHHSAEYSSFLKESGRTSGSSSSTQVTVATTRTHLQTLPKTSGCHKELVNTVTHSIYKDLLPLSAVEGSGTQLLNGQMPL